MGLTMLHVVTSTVRRGAEVFAVDLDRALSARGHETALRALVAGPDSGGVDIPTLGRNRLGPSTLYRLRREAQSRDVVLGHGSSTLPACVLAMTGLAIPFVYRSIGDPGFWAVSATRHQRTSFLLNRAEIVVALWPGAVDPLIDRFDVDESRIRVIPNAVRADGFSPVSAEARTQARHHLDLPVDAPVLAYIGALTPEKGVGAAIEAVAEIPDAVLAIAGEGWQRPQLERLATERAPGRVRFLGAQEGSRRVALAAADAVTLPSHTEGVPAVLIEAGLSELPVVATAVGGVSEVVVDGETGLLVPPGDHAALVEGLRTVLERPGRFGPAARSRCLARFDLEDVVERWSAVLAEASALQAA